MSSDPLDRPEPWMATHLAVLVTAQVVALAILIGAWVAASGATRTGVQLGWLAFAALGVGGAAAVDGMWLLLGRNAAGRHQMLSADVVLGPREPAPVVADRLVVGPAMTHYHKSSCLMVQNKAVRPLTVRTANRRALRPCDICVPEVGP